MARSNLHWIDMPSKDHLIRQNERRHCFGDRSQTRPKFLSVKPSMKQERLLSPRADPAQV
jgi:hypothetical protein